jgi:hypothetical protein
MSWGRTRGAPKRAREVDIEDRLPFVGRKRLGAFQHRAYAGVVDKDIQPPHSSRARATAAITSFVALQGTRDCVR